MSQVSVIELKRLIVLVDSCDKKVKINIKRTSLLAEYVNVCNEIESFRCKLHILLLQH